MCFDLTAFYQGKVVMFNRRLIDGKNVQISADYDPGNRQFTVTNGKITLPSD